MKSTRTMAPPTTDTTDRRSERRTSISSISEGFHRPRRTLSNTSSMFSFMSQSGKKDEDRAVVYDPLERKLWVDRKENLQSTLRKIFTLSGGELTGFRGGVHQSPDPRHRAQSLSVYGNGSSGEQGKDFRE